jgi:antitoxin HigA-1
MMSAAHAPIHPGEILLEEFLGPLRINEIVHGKRAITPDTALRLARALGTSDRFWMNLQTRYDLDVQIEAHRAELDQITPLVA